MIYITSEWELMRMGKDVKGRIGRTLKEIRETFGYSVDDVSKKLGVGTEDVERVERGENPQTARFLDVVQKYARVFGLNPVYLFDEDFRYPKVNFRAKFIGTREKKKVPRIIGLVYLVSDFYYDLTDEDLPKLPYYPVSEERLFVNEGNEVAVAKALKIVRSLREDNNVDTLEDALNVLKIYVLETDLEKLDGFSIYVPGVTIPVIVVNSRINSECRKRFTLAHELLHLLSDRNKDFPPLAEEKFFVKELKDPALKGREILANKFAQYLLVPFEDVQKSKFDKKSKEELMRKYCVSEDVLDHIARDLHKRTESYGLKCECNRQISYPRFANLLDKLSTEINFIKDKFSSLVSA